MKKFYYQKTNVEESLKQERERKKVRQEVRESKEKGI